MMDIAQVRQIFVSYVPLSGSRWAICHNEVWHAHVVLFIYFVQFSFLTDTAKIVGAKYAQATASSLFFAIQRGNLR